MNIKSLTICILLVLLYPDFGVSQITKNPNAPDSPWPEGHGTYCQQNSSEFSFTSSEQFSIEKIPLSQNEDGFSPSGSIVSEKYPSGAYVCWGTNGFNIYKTIIDGPKTTLVMADKKKIGFKIVSGYWIMNKSNTLVFMSDWKIYILKDEKQYNPYSSIQCEDIIDVSELKSDDGLDFMIGMKMLYNGMIAITTRNGKLAYLNLKEKKIVDAIDLNEKIQNNMAVEEGNYVYINTNNGTYKFVGDTLKLTKIWFAPTDKSGSTPTLLNVKEDKLLLVTNGIEPYSLMALWRDSIPENWLGLQGFDRRVAGIVKLDYGLGTKGKIAPTENSLLVSDSTILVANWTGLWPRFKANNRGLATYSWDSEKNSFIPGWKNNAISLPNSMQALSIGSQTVYAVGRREENDEWTFEGIDWTTGASLFSVPLGVEIDNNITGSGIQIGWEGDIIFMGPKAIFRIKKK